MKHVEEHFATDDGLNLYYQVWQPERKVKAIIQIIHGLAEHSSRYNNVVDFLVPNGFAVYINDLRGHGKSEGTRGYVNSFNDYSEDARKFTHLIKEQEENIPFFLLGHSMGVLIAVDYAKKYPEELTGIIFSGFGYPTTSKVNPLVVLLSGILSKIRPKGKIKIDLAPDVSSDPNVVEAYKNDPLIFKFITYRLGAEYLKITKKFPESLSQIQIPVLVQSGEHDKLTLETSELFSHISAANKQLKLYKGLYHEVYNEPEPGRNQVLTDLKEWLENHI
ncbi:MAG: lysophospholipase [Candidatus Heimdallarchaeota archaeon]|nr:MAG: lysophospholipase [Candidatus Heimdallarchaeota archaeon]